ncbi:hypothetical protein Celaphus_00014541, partial [Cervus elaphus hippelaphus]
MRRASWMSLGMIVTRLAWMAHRLVGLARLLQRHHGRALEAQIGLEVLRDLTHEPLERQLADQQLGGLLVAANLTQSHRTGAVAVRLLHATSGRRALAGRLSGQLFARRLAAGGLASSLLSTSHVKGRNNTATPNASDKQAAALLLYSQANNYWTQEHSKIPAPCSDWSISLPVCPEESRAAFP